MIPSTLDNKVFVTTKYPQIDRRQQSFCNLVDRATNNLQGRCLWQQIIRSWRYMSEVN